MGICTHKTFRHIFIPISVCNKTMQLTLSLGSPGWLLEQGLRYTELLLFYGMFCLVSSRRPFPILSDVIAPFSFLSPTPHFQTTVSWDGDQLVCEQRGEKQNRGWRHWLEGDQLHLVRRRGGVPNQLFLLPLPFSKAQNGSSSPLPAQKNQEVSQLLCASSGRQWPLDKNILPKSSKVQSAEQGSHPLSALFFEIWSRLLGHQGRSGNQSRVRILALVLVNNVWSAAALR